MHIFIINPKAGNGKGIELISRLNEIKECKNQINNNPI